ncbi:MAG: hypothetical protein H6682_10290 [Candidatus Eisenbacteria bacterium]|nr:hypothetical protein [Candidatus Eisenbacteria bacterium]
MAWFLSLLPTPCEATSCGYIAPWEMLEFSEVVFEGTILGDALSELPDSERKFAAAAVRIQVDRQWVGEADHEVIVSGGPSLSKWLDHVGESYFFCSSQVLLVPGQPHTASGFLRTGECVRNSPLPCAEVELLAIELLVAGEPEEVVADRVASWLVTHMSALAPDCERFRPNRYSRNARDLGACMSLVGSGRRAEILDFVELECRSPERAKALLREFVHHCGDEWPGSVEWLLRMIENASPSIRADAIRETILRPIARDPRVRPAIVRATHDDDPKVASEALWIYGKRFAQPGEGPSFRATLLDIFATEPRVREGAVSVLRSWADSLTSEQRVELLSSADPLVWRTYSTQFFSKRELDDAESQELLRWLDLPLRRVEAVRALGFAMDHSYYLLSHLTEWLPSLSKEEQKQIVRAQMPAGTPELLALLPRLPGPVLESALDLRLPEYSPAFAWQIETGLASPSASARLRALERSQWATQDVEPHGRAVLSCLLDPDADVREAALGYLEQLGPHWRDQAIPALETLAAAGDSLAPRAKRLLSNATEP